MSSLSYNGAARAYVLTTNERNLAVQLKGEGWGRDTGHRGPGLAMYTRSPYAALSHFDKGDGDVHARLGDLADAYRSSLALDHPTSYPSPPGFEFMPFQRAGISYILDRQHALCGDDMGTGKTQTAIGVANEMQAERVLVACPGNARLQWQRRVREWSTIRRVMTYPILRSADGVSPVAHWTFISYDLLRNEEIKRALMRLDFDLFVCDEAHYLKTADSQRTRAALGSLSGEVEGVMERAERTLALTGTPLPNRPREFYNLFRHLAWHAINWQSEDAFTQRYNPSRQFTVRTKEGEEKTVVEEKIGRLPELRARARCEFMVRRTMEKVQPQMPPLSCELTYVEPNGEIRKVLAAERLLDIDVDHLEDMDMATRGHVATVRREMGVAKVPRVVEHVRGLLDGGLEKVVVAAFHREVMAELAERLGSWGVSVVIGGQTPTQRDKAIWRFVQDPRCRIFLGQLQAAGEAVDGIQRVCRRGVFAEASWVPKDNDQFMRRIWRMGQSRGVLWQFLVAPGSLDEKILGRSIEKATTIHETLDGGN